MASRSIKLHQVLELAINSPPTRLFSLKLAVSFISDASDRKNCGLLHVCPASSCTACTGPLEVSERCQAQCFAQLPASQRSERVNTVAEKYTPNGTLKVLLHPWKAYCNLTCKPLSFRVKPLVKVLQRGPHMLGKYDFAQRNTFPLDFMSQSGS